MKKMKILPAIVAIIAIITVIFAGCGETAGKSAYELAVENGFTGTVQEWLESLVVEGKSAYELAAENGFEGTLDEWLESLRTEGKSAYELAIENGFEGTVEEWLESLQGEDGSAASAGKSAYELAVENGFEGTVDEWLESLRGEASDTVSVAYAANKAILSAVTVYSEFSTGETTSTSAGSGIIIEDDKENGDAYIITNYHVVYDNAATPKISENIVVRLYALNYTDYSISATYLGGSLTYDIAVLKVDNSDIYKNSSARPAVCSDTLTNYVGEAAIAVGNPQGTGLSVTTGIISVESEKIEMKGADGVTDVEFRVLRIDTAVNSGNSGGGLFNADGELIGIVNAKIISSNVENIGYAIPLSVAVNAYRNIIRNCDGEENTVIKRCLLGVSITAGEIVTSYNAATGKTDIIEKIVVHSVGEGAAAEGLLEVDDEVVSFTYGGVTYTLTRVFQIVDFSLNFIRNETVTMGIIRDGTPMNVPIPLINVINIQ